MDTPSVIKLIDEILKHNDNQQNGDMQNDRPMEIEDEDSEEESLLAPTAGEREIPYSRDMEAMLDESPEPPSKKLKRDSTPRERWYYPECEPIST